MNRFMEQGILKEVKAKGTISYILEESTMLSATGYNILKSQGFKKFIRCEKCLYNGKVKLVFLPEDNVPLRSIIGELDVKTTIAVMEKLLRAIIETKNNGFLSYQNIELDLDKIFIDQSLQDIKLVYLAINSLDENKARLEADCRTLLLEMLPAPWSSEQMINEFRLQVADKKVSLETLLRLLEEYAKNTVFTSESIVTQPIVTSPIVNSPRSMPRMKIYLKDYPDRELFAVTKTEFIMGKSQRFADGIISFNEAISRKHCKIVWDMQQFVIIDLESSNHTYLNGQKLAAGRPYAVNDGDMVRMANSDFLIRIEEE